MAEMKHPQKAVYDAFCCTTYVVNEIKNVESRLHFLREEANTAVERASEAQEIVNTVCNGVRALAQLYHGSNVATPEGKPLEEVLLELIGEEVTS